MGTGQVIELQNDIDFSETPSLCVHVYVCVYIYIYIYIYIYNVDSINRNLSQNISPLILKSFFTFFLSFTFFLLGPGSSQECKFYYAC